MAISPDEPVRAGQPSTQSPSEHHRPWGWIAVCVLLVLVAGGLAIWAFGLRSDLDDQRVQTAEAQAQSEQANKEVDALSGQIDEISQTVTDAGDQLAQAGADAQKNAQATLDGLGTKLESVKGEVEKAAQELGGSKEDAAP
jgi:flagellar basal body-associated protein FliL